MLGAAALCCCLVGQAPKDSTVPKLSAEHDSRLRAFQAIEFRRYTTKPGERKRFAQYFDAFFPEAFQQLGAIALGSFFERKNPDGFTWIRGFHTIDERATANAAFYYGPVWNEHRDTVNDLLGDTDNVMLLRPLNPERGLMVLPAVDPVNEPNGAYGIIVAQIFAVKIDSVDSFAAAAEPTFAKYRSAGSREAGVLVTLDARNNFPQLPVRTDGPYLVWLGVLKDNQTFEKDFTPVVEASLAALNGSGLLRSTPQLVILDPTSRSRLRWLPGWK